MKIVGVIPVRMASKRFPGKPLAKILGKPMVEHVFERARMFDSWSHLVVATCDDEISRYCKYKNYETIMTSPNHTRALDRVAEAALDKRFDLKPNDLVVCVQGDEPMLRPDMIKTVLEPLLKNEKVPCTMLAMTIDDEDVFLNPDTVKVVHDLSGKVLYTSRSPIPYCKKGDFNADLGALRVHGIFAFRWKSLKWFTKTTESPLEILESCDSNRICDHGGEQKVAKYPAVKSYSVDSPSDIDKVETAMRDDLYWRKY